MNEISCDVCMDLVPLVRDGIASEGSRQAVKCHLKGCDRCLALWEENPLLYEENTLPIPDGEKALEKFRRKIQIFTAMLLMFGMFFGLSLTAGNDMFYNSLIMPVIGALGYVIFRWKAVYAVPLLLLGTHSVINFWGLIRGMEYLDFPSVVMWSAIYSIFVWIGVLIAWLLHFAFSKE